MTELPTISVKLFTLATSVSRYNWPAAPLMVDTEGLIFRRKPDGKLTRYGRKPKHSKRA